LADLLLVNGNPLENLDLVGDPDRNFNLIMKDGKDLQEHPALSSTFW
jgi:imidazolonepropionase-like amidohydrolase